ncbi:NADH dehydrogenase [ubiquinone] iron-sulfur protein 6, mitochondrial [Petromyzon marinus]|uniref:NADH dehydrogenase [ubiquinone] iron-sulfur protein 6, mitochondrial n=1 Tax=Petromyzon marinus TaxID=7757 RepID=A0AAJ7U6P8_PETMA|nr:NADH dehydrogenase [ubiquinone] iron-sulfur protein 6, mitochondrial [Petromyzon marinus]
MASCALSRASSVALAASRAAGASASAASRASRAPGAARVGPLLLGAGARRGLAAGPGVQDGEKVTHTGQVYDEKDYRRVRFVGRQKEINEQFAVDMIAAEPVREVATRVTHCDGGGGALGHPRVYINLDNNDKEGVCGYCGLRFRQAHHHHH